MKKQTLVVEAEEFPFGEAQEPLYITITEAGSITARLYTLLRQVLPVLENPDSLSNSYRQTLASTIRKELEGE